MTNGISLFDRLEITLPQSRSGVRSFLYNNLSRSVWDDYSGSEILRGLRDNDLGIRSGDFYQIRRQILEEKRITQELRSTQDDYFIPQDLWNKDHGWEIGTNLLYRFEVSGVNPFTGEREETAFSLGSNTELLLGEAKDSLMALLAGEEEFYGIVVDTVTIDGVYAKKDFYGGR